MRIISEQSKALEAFQETVRSLQASIDKMSMESERSRARMEKQLSDITEELKTERKKSKALEKELEKYRNRNARSNRNQ